MYLWLIPVMDASSGPSNVCLKNMQYYAIVRTFSLVFALARPNSYLLAPYCRKIRMGVTPPASSLLFFAHHAAFLGERCAWHGRFARAHHDRGLEPRRSVHRRRERCAEWFRRRPLEEPAAAKSLPGSAHCCFTAGDLLFKGGLRPFLFVNPFLRTLLTKTFARERPSRGNSLNSTAHLGPGDPAVRAV
jgi:hypothetical protein